MDSLDMLQNFLNEYQGNLLMVSHDRDFLDNTVSSILAFEDDGTITYHLGGYSDYLEFKNRNKVVEKEKALKAKIIKENKGEGENSQQKSQKLSYKYVHELKKLPDKIEKLEKKIIDLSEELSETEDRNSANLAFISMEIAKFQKELEEAENRWLELSESS
jgi:ATP-binding cassette subfamily F protein uup